MNLVDGDGAVEAVAAVPRSHPALVFPFVLEVPDDGGRLGWRFVVKRQRICLVDLVAVVSRNNAVLVDGSFLETGNKGFPDS